MTRLTNRRFSGIAQPELDAQDHEQDDGGDDGEERQDVRARRPVWASSTVKAITAGDDQQGVDDPPARRPGGSALVRRTLVNTRHRSAPHRQATMMSAPTIV